MRRIRPDSTGHCRYAARARPHSPGTRDLPDAEYNGSLVSSHLDLRPPREERTDPAYTSSEHTVVEAVLKVDSSGYPIKHPYINNALNRLLAKWTFKLCTAGGFKNPRFRPCRRRIPGSLRGSGRRCIGLAASRPGNARSRNEMCENPMFLKEK